MTRSRRSKILWLLVIGLGFIGIAWFAESALFMDLGAHSTNTQAFEVIKSAVSEGKFSNLKDESEIHNAALWVANDASRAVMSSVRYSRSFSMWIYIAGGITIATSGLIVMRTPILAVLNTGSSVTDDWRLQNQESYLLNAHLVWCSYKKPSQDWDHDHCEFCHVKFMEASDATGEDILHEGYRSLDANDHLICKQCYQDFSCRFMFRIVDSSK